MTEELVTIEVDGREIQARKGAMLIEVTDAEGIYVPRFCYHEKLSVAANCRMCLVEVEKAPKPMPACATPVMEGMKVFTRSPAARFAQKSVMEFLLINHPLDCPICDQGGECELQDLAMGYGQDGSSYGESKRVVADKDIGPLVATEMTRCIQCTRCVRFGEEIAGVRELGATGRGEDMQIGTYIEKSIDSEMSGNIIDLCPVGALTSKPYRFSARAWELRQSPAVAPHDCIGSNVYLHVRGSEVMRAVPRRNESINEVWLSDRDRFGYVGLHADDRLAAPAIRTDGEWRETDWETALQFAAQGLTEVINNSGENSVGGLASASSTLEELFLFQKLMRGIGVWNIDHRLRQGDFSGQDEAPLFPWLGQGVADLEQADAVLLVGSNLRKEQPIANHRLRKAVLAGADVCAVNPVDYEFNYPLAHTIVTPPSAMASALGAIAKALSGGGDAELDGLLGEVDVEAAARAIADRLRDAKKGTVLLGGLAAANPDYAALCYLAGRIADLSGAALGYLPDAANGTGAWLAGVLPHRCPAGDACEVSGLDARAMFEQPLDAYVLMGVEPELDCWDAGAARQALQDAKFTVCLTAYRTPAMDAYADVLLPVGLFAETSGTYVNAAGDWQSFAGTIAPPGQARPAWKVLRVLGNRFELEGFDYTASEQVRDELQALVAGATPDNSRGPQCPAVLNGTVTGLQRIGETAMYSVDALVRRSGPLQKTADAADGRARVNAATASHLGVVDGGIVNVTQGYEAAHFMLALDERVPDGCVLLHAGHESSAGLGPSFGDIEITQG